jgi:hypothetical protein
LVVAWVVTTLKASGIEKYAVEGHESASAAAAQPVVAVVSIEEVAVARPDIVCS